MGAFNNIKKFLGEGKQSSLLTLLDKGLIDIHRGHDQINSGGCAVFATLAYPFISKYFDNIKVRTIHYHGRSSDDIDQTRINILENDKSVYCKQNWWDLSINHVMLEFEADGELYLLDSEGVQKRIGFEKRSGHTVCKGSFTYKEIEALSSKGSGWNTCFDRDQISNISLGIDNLFLNTLPQQGHMYG